MIPISSDPPKGVVDRRDGSTKGECGITTVGCLYCKDQISGSASYIKNYDQMEWGAKNGCNIATCPFWNDPGCWKNIGGGSKDPKKHCPIYKRRQRTGSWNVEKEVI